MPSTNGICLLRSFTVTELHRHPLQASYYCIQNQCYHLIFCDYLFRFSGAMAASFSYTETLIGLIGLVAADFIYSFTVDIYKQAVFLFQAAVYLMAFFTTLWVHIIFPDIDLICKICQIHRRGPKGSRGHAPTKLVQEIVNKGSWNESWFLPALGPLLIHLNQKEITKKSKLM